MHSPSLMIFYVTDMPKSRAFYEAVLEAEPVEASPTFAMFRLESGFSICIWQKDGVTPPVSTPGQAGELAFILPDAAAVDARYSAYRLTGYPILQKPEQLDFGYALLVADPDGHRLRMFAPG